MKLILTRHDIEQLVRNFVIDLDPKKRDVTIDFEQEIGTDQWCDISKLRAVVHLTDETKEKEDAKKK